MEGLGAFPGQRNAVLFLQGVRREVEELQRLRLSVCSMLFWAVKGTSL